MNACFVLYLSAHYRVFAYLLLRPAGGVKHSDSDLVETRMPSARKALR